jgi:dUTP pyrophosphatase
MKTQKISPKAKIPSYATEGSAGMDLTSVEEYNLAPMERKAISIGIAIELDPGLEAQVRPRSGLAIKHGITVINSPGTIDSDYRGEVKVLLINLGKSDFLVTEGMKIAQIVISNYSKVAITQVQSLSSTERGEGGFGSTGK